MIKGRESKALVKAPSTDFLVCFPTRAHLTLMPKQIHSPSRPSEPNRRHHNHHHHLKKINTRAASSGAGGTGSPLLWTKNNQIQASSGGGAETSEPTSPKVTCAGQIKVRPRSSTGCRNWQSVMEEIERIHKRAKHKKKSSWAGTLGFKKDVMSFLTCLRHIRFDFRCFGSFPEQNISSDDEEDDDEEEEEDSFKDAAEDDQGNNNAVFSKWFMVLQENQSSSIISSTNGNKFQEEVVDEDSAPAVPPPNALLLMRCRSAPALSLLEEKENEEKNMKESVEETMEEKTEVKEEEKKKKRETLAIVMKYDTDFYKLSSDIAQETWVVGGLKDAFSRSRSCRR